MTLSFDEVDSTNDLVLRWIAKSKPIDGTVITSAYQRQGRGQIGRKWMGTPGKNLAYSAVLYPPALEASETFHAQMALSTAVLHAVREFSALEGLKLKWPNDLYYGDKKLGGMLVQTSLSGSRVQHLVFGTGININEEDFHESLENPVSLLQITGKRHDHRELVDLLNKYLSDAYKMILDAKWSQVSEIYHNSMLGRGQRRKFLHFQEHITFEAVVKGVTQDGRLHLVTDSADRFFVMNEIKWI